ncbi:hypothetical protein IG631_09732 [Alternaria alternata]|nr:hypothetical protein IG631_09732 [Alternaria alternata]
MLLRETVLELALESASGDQKTSLHTLQHVVMWGLVLLEINAEPVTPRLSDKTEMHRGMASFILDQPSDVPVHEDADPDVDSYGMHKVQSARTISLAHNRQPWCSRS